MSCSTIRTPFFGLLWLTASWLRAQPVDFFKEWSKVDITGAYDSDPPTGGLKRFLRAVTKKLGSITQLAIVSPP